MNTRLGVLAILALVQIVLIAFVSLSGNRSDEAVASWLSMDVDAVTALTVADADREVTVVKTDEGWLVGDHRADGDKISALLAKLDETDAGWPVATSADARERFEVQEDNFQRRIRIQNGSETLTDLYLGTSPGFQRQHARLADANEIYSVALANYEFPADIDGWLDKKIFTVDASAKRIEVRFANGETTVLTANDEGWLFNGAAANQDEANTYANRFKTLRIQGLAPEVPLPVTRATFVIDTEAGQSAFDIAAVGEGEDVTYQIRRDAGDYFTLATYVAEQLLLTDVNLAAAPESEAPVAIESDDG